MGRSNASVMGAEAALQLAARQVARGDFEQAERALLRLLRWQPRSSEALNLLSAIANANGRSEEALDRAVTAIALDPGRAEFHFSHGRALKSLQRIDEAVEAYRRALSLRSDYAEVHVSLGIALRLRGNLDEAIDCYRRALRIRPDFAEALSNLGNALTERIGRQHGDRLTAEDLREAEHVQRRALELAPRNPNLLHNLGLLLKMTGRYDESVELLNNALGLDSSRVDTCLQFGELLFKKSRYDLARQLFMNWLGEHAPHPEIILQLAHSLTELGQTEEALTWLDRLRELRPDSPEAQHLRGRILQRTFAHSVDVDGKDTLAYFRSAIEARPDYFEAICSYLLMRCYVEEDPVVLAAEHRARMAPLVVDHDAPMREQPRDRHRIRIGYVSYDFKRHSVAYFLEGILEAHDRSRFEIHCYKTNEADDAVTARLKALADHWVESGHLSDVQLADHIRSDGIDVLLDLSGLTSGSRLGVFNLRPAPCQITYLGYPTTTGATCFDFRISDAVIDLPDQEGFGTEEVLRCPGSMFCYRPGPVPDVGPLPALACGHVTFGSFNNFAKVGERTLRLWREVLRAVPESQLRLKAASLLQHGNREFVRQHFASHGIAPDRIVLQPWSEGVQSHLAAYHEVDIALDTFPYNGATTTCEALYMGAPVITLTGQTHPSRMGASILGAVDLSGFVTHEDAEYVQTAITLAGDLPRLVELRSTMRHRMDGARLLDKTAFTRDFESLLMTALERKQRIREYEHVE